MIIDRPSKCEACIHSHIVYYYINHKVSKHLKHTAYHVYLCKHADSTWNPSSNGLCIFYTDTFRGSLKTWNLQFLWPKLFGFSRPSRNDCEDDDTMAVLNLLKSWTRRETKCLRAAQCSAQTANSVSRRVLSRCSSSPNPIIQGKYSPKCALTFLIRPWAYWIIKGLIMCTHRHLHTHIHVTLYSPLIHINWIRSTRSSCFSPQLISKLGLNWLHVDEEFTHVVSVWHHNHCGAQSECLIEFSCMKRLC